MSLKRSSGATPGFSSRSESGFYLPDKPTIDTPDDDFGSTTLDAKWTAVSGTSGTVDLFEVGEVEKYDLATRPGWLLTQAGSVANQKVELRQDWTLGDGESIILALSPAVSLDGASLLNNEIWTGISLNDNDTGYDAGEYVFLSLETQANEWRLLAFDGSTLGYTYESWVSAAMHYFRLSRVGSVIWCFFSLDGTTWNAIGKTTRAATATNVWIFNESVAASSEPVPIVAVKWIRQGTNNFDPW